MISVDMLRENRNGKTVRQLLLLLSFAVLHSDHTNVYPTSAHQDHTAHRPQFGSAKGLITMSDDFDEPLEDFNDYM